MKTSSSIDKEASVSIAVITTPAARQARTKMQYLSFDITTDSPISFANSSAVKEPLSSTWLTMQCEVNFFEYDGEQLFFNMLLSQPNRSSVVFPQNLNFVERFSEGSKTAESSKLYKHMKSKLMTIHALS
jgi:hypothetical protein